MENTNVSALYTQKINNQSIVDSSINSGSSIVKNSSELTALLCIFLENEKFDFNATIEVIRSLKSEKLIYSEISNHLFVTSKENVATFLSNVAKLKEKVFDPNSKEYEDLRHIVLKLYDHTQLANHQVNMFKIGQERFDNQLKSSDFFNEKIESNRETIDSMIKENNNFINQKIDSVNSQVVSLVALFTAMAFLVFGGLSSFESIFSNIQDVSVLKLLMLSSVWGIAILNTIAVFMFFTSRVIGRSFQADPSENNTLFNRYPYLILGNYILLSIFFISSSLYLYIKHKGYKLPDQIICNETIAFAVLFVLLAIIGYCCFFKKPKNKVKNSNEINPPSED